MNYEKGSVFSEFQKLEAKQVFYSLQLLRFLSALAVLLFHLHLFPSGYKGVDVFFVISGFVMYLTLFYKSKPTALKFLVNRITKIFFLYWVALIFLFIIQPFYFDFAFLKTLFLFPSHFPLLGLSWSLSYELYFYFLLGLVAYFIPAIFQKRVVLIVFILSFILTIVNLVNPVFKGTILNFLLGSNLWQFVLGLVCGYFALSLNEDRSKHYLIAALVSGVLLAVIQIPYGDSSSYIVYGLLSFLLILFLASFEKGLKGRKVNGKIINYLGEASYGIYLFGPVVTLWLGQESTSSKLLIITITILFSFLFNFFVEGPFLRWTRTLFTKI